MSSLEPGFDMILGKSFQLYLFLLVYSQEDVSFHYENCRYKKYYLLFSIAEPIQETSEEIPAPSQLEFLIPEIFLCDQLRLRQHPRRMLLRCWFLAAADMIYFAASWLQEFLQKLICKEHSHSVSADFHSSMLLSYCGLYSSTY